MFEGFLTKIEEKGLAFNKKRIEGAFKLAGKKYALIKETPYCVKELISSLLSLKIDEDTLYTALFYDLFLQGKITSEEVRKHFGSKVLKLLAAVKQLRSLDYSQNDKKSQVEILRKMFVVMARDMRVVLIVLSLRLCEMKRVLRGDFSDDERELIARETLNVYVPIASRLGIYRLKTQLEDQAFQYFNPNEYRDIARQLEGLDKTFQVSISAIKKELDQFFKEEGIEVEIYARLKSVYSIYKKLKRKNYTSISDIYDVFAMRVILPSVYDDKGKEILDELYRVLGLIHSKWRPLSRRFKDYVAVPKPNGYRSLHTVVLGLAPKNVDNPVEIQIRSRDMHDDAEYGLSSHWVYKTNRAMSNHPYALKKHADWLKNLAIVGDTNLDVFQDRIFVLTPRGEIKDLPKGATPLDFAYSVHTDVGHQCVMAKVDGAIAPLDSELKNGYVVEIMTKKESAPKLQWLSIVKSGFAKTKIKAYFGALNRENNLKEGRKILNTQLAMIGKPLLDQNYSILKHCYGQKLNLAQREKILEEVGKGVKLASDVIRSVFPYEDILVAKNRNHKNIDKSPKRKKKEPAKVALEDLVLVGGEAGLPVKLASCCKPGVKDEVVGYVTTRNTITIHKASCLLLDSFNTDRIIFASWKSRKHGSVKVPVKIKLLVLARIGLMRDITAVISSLGVAILDLQIKKKGGLFEDYFLLDLVDIERFDLLLDKLEAVRGVVKVTKEGE